MENENEKKTADTAVRKKPDMDKLTELIIVIMLGVTALLTAWASWIGSLHGGNQATNYATSNNLASEGNSEYNAGVQQMNQDMILWNDISSLQIEIVFAQNNNNEAELAKLCNQLFYKMAENVSETMAAKIDWNTADNSSSDPQATILAWLEKENSMSSPFFDEIRRMTSSLSPFSMISVCTSVVKPYLYFSCVSSFTYLLGSSCCIIY